MAHKIINLKLDKWTKIAVFRHVLMSCSFTALSAFKLLNSLGVISRVAGVYSSKDFYHAHSLNEVYINNKWILVDFTKKIFICDENGNKLSLKEVYKKGDFSKCCLQLIGNGYYSSNSGVDYRINNDGYMFNLSLIPDFYSMCYPKNLQDWFNRFDIFMLSENPVHECRALDNSKNNFKQHHPL